MSNKLKKKNKQPEQKPTQMNIMARRLTDALNHKLDEIDSKAPERRKSFDSICMLIIDFIIIAVGSCFEKKEMAAPFLFAVSLLGVWYVLKHIVFYVIIKKEPKRKNVIFAVIHGCVAVVALILAIVFIGGL